MSTYIYNSSLSLAVFLPIFFGLSILIFGNDRKSYFIKVISLIAAVVSFLIVCYIYNFFNQSNNSIQFEENYKWIGNLNINYHIGIDGISLLFLLLTSFITIIVVLAAWKSIENRVSEYMAAFLILSGLMNGVFVSLDAILFYVFFEATLIPMYIIIGIWGGPNRFYAAFKFFLYTLLGSLLMFIAFIYMYEISGSFEILTWHKIKISYVQQILIFIAFMAAFAVKIPMWPFHTWLPDAHVEAPTGGSIILAAIMLKLGAYGFLRLSLPILPDASASLSSMMIVLSLIAIIYIGFIAIVQEDMKKLVAYSSIAHMGFVTLGMFVFNVVGIEGAIVQMISHGFISAAMFFSIGVLYDRAHSRIISDYNGLVSVMPRFVTFFVFFSMANCGLPATSGFVGEFLVIMGSVEYSFPVAILAATSLILSASYSLWMLKRIAFGRLKVKHDINSFVDLDKREFLISSILALAIIFMGIYPKPFTDVINLPAKCLLEHLSVTKL
ncbi:NADH dehydrogenase I subunit M [Candidatus Kinetoplastibacterium blastocrithidii TCC012E]|uniref:NADH dehydrogenase I subunit M n=1 Tax=Candidatus Kinetoplastidibacterium blastocrithidiae TCC012E TaxID=1208922 RepID=M1MDW7_9PROT|nr:NADH-quinone oxidoreductase subunit M [Candidatus Kinetoplastibacterium blastocrithidii]AGF49920.1 NADH dehydrogenase I subunit M [Candidatus Kinetoplastibacterium blastocrithidii TCC012E]